MAGAPFEVPAKYTKATPMGGRVLIKIAETERETKGGVLLTEGSQQKPTSGARYL
jgi:co-chaperonin GroES (HSP10)